MKEEIVAKTLEFLGKSGFTGLSMGPLAKYCNMGVANIYHYFGNREGLIQAVFAEIWKRWSTAVAKDKSPVPDKGGYKARFHALWMCSYRFFARHKAYVAILQTCESEKLIAQPTLKQCDILFATLDNLVQKGIEKGNIENLEPLFVRRYFLDQVFLAIKSDKLDPQILMEICYKGIKAKKG